MFGFFILGRDAVVADERIGHRHDLAFVGWIGQHFLVAGHTGVENDFSGCFSRCAKGPPGKDGSIFQCQFRSVLHSESL